MAHVKTATKQECKVKWNSTRALPEAVRGCLAQIGACCRVSFPGQLLEETLQSHRPWKGNGEPYSAWSLQRSEPHWPPSGLMTH